MSEPFVGRELSEELESGEALSRELKELNEMTNEPGTHIEQKLEIGQSEAVESALTKLVNTALENPENTVSIDPNPIWYSVSESGGEEVSVLPIPIPKPVEDVAGEPGSGSGEVSATPINIPKEAYEADSSLPSGTGGELSVEITTAGSHVSKLPIPIPREADQLNITFNGSTFAVRGGSLSSLEEAQLVSTDDQVSATPINTPYPVPPDKELTEKDEGEGASQRMDPDPVT